jgi:hypothetical protein
MIRREFITLLGGMAGSRMSQAAEETAHCRVLGRE